MDYNLAGLNYRDFQHLVQAIARKQIGPGVVSFGDGKDGNRDATFTGMMNYPSNTDPWNGYLIIGCKFRQRPTGDAKKELQWALSQVKGDLDKFLDADRSLNRPDYYLFVTSIPLTAAQDGGRDEVTALLADYSEKLDLKGTGCWDYNDLRGFLDGDSSLRRAYGHFITAGDVLAQMSAWLDLQQTSFDEIISTFLQKELIADSFAKLEATAEDPETQILLPQIFIDLPIELTEEAAIDLPNEKTFHDDANDDDDDDDDDRHQTFSEKKTYSSDDIELKLPIEFRTPDHQRFADLILSEGASVLRRSALANCPPHDTRPNERYVLVGGPGQGKSTLGIYIAQLHRAALLADRPRHSLDDKAQRALASLTKGLPKSIQLPVCRRFPVRIELISLSSAKANDNKLTLMTYIASSLSQGTNASLSLGTVKRWLAEYPWILILDGLDEVPVSSNRHEIVKLIDDFLVDLAAVDADVLTVLTTRPQGYAHEFNPQSFRHVYLSLLGKEYVKEYGRLLLKARHHANRARRKELMRGLINACNSEATTRLMRTPLQITIMALLLEEIGEPPQQRYRLFFEYYETIYKRELKRKLLGGLLSSRRADIDHIHHFTGLDLQIRAETDDEAREGGQRKKSEAALSDDQFRSLVSRRLGGIGVKGNKAAELLDRISDGTLQRLVFLVRRKEGWVRFDIQSLQEFMAAEAIMSGTDEQVTARISRIASSSYWRNVMLFCVGHCFSGPEYLVDRVITICEMLNSSHSASRHLGSQLAGEAAEKCKAGSLLALDILRDGTSRQHPAYELRFFKIAAELLSLRNDEHVHALATTFNEELQDTFIEVILDRIGQKNFARSYPALTLAMRLAEQGESWARKLVDANWPDNIDEQRELFEFSGVPWESNICRDRFVEFFPKAPPYSVAAVFLIRRRAEVLPDSPAWLRSAIHVARNGLFRGVDGAEKNSRLFSVMFSGGSIRVSVLSITAAPFLPPGFEHVEDLPQPCHPTWLPLIAGIRFCKDPTHLNLAKQLRWYASSLGESEVPDSFVWMPWTLASCLRAGQNAAQIIELADKAERGELGNIETWLAAERRWMQQGIGEDDLLSMDDSRWPLDARIDEEGFPTGTFVVESPENGSDVFGAILDVLDRAESRGLRKTPHWLVTMILHSVSNILQGRHPSAYIPVSIRRRLFRYIVEMERVDSRALALACAPPVEEDDDGWIQMLNEFGLVLDQRWYGSIRVVTSERIASIFAAYPDRYPGLAAVLVALASCGNSISVPESVLAARWRKGDQIESDVTCLLLYGRLVNGANITEIRDAMSGAAISPTIYERVYAMISASSDAAVLARWSLECLREMRLGTLQDSELRNGVIDSLRNYVGGLPSGLADQSLRERLGLPDLV